MFITAKICLNVYAYIYIYMDMKLFSINDFQKVANISPLKISSRMNKLVSHKGRVCVLVSGQTVG